MTKNKPTFRQRVRLFFSFKAKYESERIGRMKFEADSITLQDRVRCLKEDNVHLSKSNRMLEHALKQLREKHTKLIVKHHVLQELQEGNTDA